MALMDIIKARHSIRKYTNEQISREDLEKILEAGNFAPNAGGGQRSMMVAIRNKELATHIGKMNVAAFCMMENMVLQATESGIASCIISRGYETFDSEEGRRLMCEWGVPDGYTCQGFVILGYIDGEQPHSKPRKPGRVKIVE